MNPQRNIAGVWKVSRTWTGWALVVSLAWLSVARAQDAGTDNTQLASNLEIKVTQASSKGPLISVPVNQGVLVDISQPVREVRIANPDIATVTVTSPKQLLINGKSYGSTQLMTTIDGGEQRVFTVSVDLDLERLQASIRTLVPRAKVTAQPLLDTVVLSGTAPDVESAEHIMQVAGIYSPRVINHIKVAGVQQVMLRVTVAEMSRTASRQLGFNGWMAGDDFPNVFGVSNIGGINPSNIGAVADASAISTIPFAVGEDGIPIGSAPTLSFGFPRVQMQLFIQALRQNNLLKVLAEPNLVAISGQQASFLAGGEFPVPIATADRITVEFREFGVRLNFTPTVLDDNRIRLNVAPEVSEPDYSNAVVVSGFAVPGLIQRRVETTVELGAGQTFAIGGLLSEKSRAVTQKVPGLGDVPVLGPLFSSVEYQNEETELVVLVTPELVAPLNPDQVAYVPGSDLIPPNDWELFALGKIEGEGGATPKDEPLHNGKRYPARPSELYGSQALRLRGPIGPASLNEGA